MSRYRYKGRSRRPIEDRFWRKVDKRGPDECWRWMGFIERSGYGRARDADQKLELVHRISYRLARGAIPAGTELDHLCRNHACVNPGHLEPVSHLENVRRGLRGALRGQQ